MSYQPGPDGPPWNPPPPSGSAGGSPQWYEGSQGQPAFPGPSGGVQDPWGGATGPAPEQWSMPPEPQSLPPFNLPPTPSPKPWLKWVLIATVVIVIVAVTAVVITVVKSEGSSTGDSETVSAAPSDVASAGDKEPVSIVIEDASCDAQIPIFKNFYEGIKASGYDDMDRTVPASLWSPEERRSASEAKRVTAATIAQMGPLVKLTTHRVMRELYEQTMAYWQAWIDKVPTYVGSDDAYWAAGNSGERAIIKMCEALRYKPAQARSFLADPPIPPKSFSEVTSATPQPFLAGGADQCGEYTATMAGYYDDPVIDQWLKIDYKIVASGWDSNQRQLTEKAGDILIKLAHKLSNLGSDSGNPVMADFTAMGAQYLTAYAHALPSYTPNDNYLLNAGLALVRLVNFGCKAAA